MVFSHMHTLTQGGVNLPVLTRERQAVWKQNLAQDMLSFKDV